MQYVSFCSASNTPSSPLSGLRTAMRTATSGCKRSAAGSSSPVVAFLARPLLANTPTLKFEASLGDRTFAVEVKPKAQAQAVRGPLGLGAGLESSQRHPALPGRRACLFVLAPGFLSSIKLATKAGVQQQHPATIKPALRAGV